MSQRSLRNSRWVTFNVSQFGGQKTVDRGEICVTMEVRGHTNR